MLKKKYDLLVFVGRFQPFHNGHKEVIDRAHELAEHVLVLVGSSNRSRDMRNPFTYQERKAMIENTFPNAAITVKPLDDVMYADDRWVEQIQNAVKDLQRNNPDIKNSRTGLIGCKKDHTSYYLKLFPLWGSENVEFIDSLNATDIRNAYWMYGTGKHWVDRSNDSESFVRNSVPQPVFAFLEEFSRTPEYTFLSEEDSFVRGYKDSVSKYPRIEHTVDAVVVQSGHVLLIRRRAAPGRGMWALPGGFINLDETLEDAMIRELREETKIKVPEPVLRGSIKFSKTFDDPNRSTRARIITQAYLIRLADQTELPKVKGSDDADKAKWVPLSDLQADKLFEDHYFIIQNMVNGQ